MEILGYLGWTLAVFALALAAVVIWRSRRMGGGADADGEDAGRLTLRGVIRFDLPDANWWEVARSKRWGTHRELQAIARGWLRPVAVTLNTPEPELKEGEGPPMVAPPGVGAESVAIDWRLFDPDQLNSVLMVMQTTAWSYGEGVVSEEVLLTIPIPDLRTVLDWMNKEYADADPLAAMGIPANVWEKEPSWLSPEGQPSPTS